MEFLVAAASFPPATSSKEETFVCTMKARHRNGLVSSIDATDHNFSLIDFDTRKVPSGIHDFAIMNIGPSFVVCFRKSDHRHPIFRCALVGGPCSSPYVRFFNTLVMTNSCFYLVPQSISTMGPPRTVLFHRLFEDVFSRAFEQRTEQLPLGHYLLSPVPCVYGWYQQALRMPKNSYRKQEIPATCESLVLL
ncbi:hypothetical protein ARMSODRAFT_958552 [Armillaria solidipes]|uniref:Uncharacterized protein n=1 Tax=Armillaria solidipes TaxID=1076256 RepID=A0A2H3BM28_9AGAR|nr:hypothetical protein ARMSODRAFT_958552 [Armillaria solidipes]